jgi:hypothetical protein
MEGGLAHLAAQARRTDAASSAGEGHQALLDARARPTGLDRDSSDASRLVEREHDFELARFSADRPLPPKFTLQAG